jgi:hypothetical protein
MSWEAIRLAAPGKTRENQEIEEMTMALPRAGRAGGILRGCASTDMLRRSPALLRRLLTLGLMSGMLLVAEAEAALSQVQVGGRPEAVHVEARDVTLHEVLDALHANFNLAYRSDDGLDTRITGTFNGPLQRVAARILEGYDFAMKITPQGIDVLVLRQGQAGGKVIAASTLASLKPPAKPMTAAEANRGLAR